MSDWVCAICGTSLPGGNGHREDCPNHKDARLIRLEKRVAELEKRLLSAESVVNAHRILG